MADLLIRNARIVDEGPVVDIAIEQGRVSAVGTLSQEQIRPSPRVIDAGAHVVLPGLIESHIHLDKGLLERRRQNRSGTLAEAIAITSQLKRTFTYDDIYARAEQVLRWAILHGVAYLRSHVEVDPLVGLTGLRALADLRIAYRDQIDMQFVAFPQEGILKTPGTDRLLDEAFEQGADLLGGVPYNDNDPDAHIDFLFSLARARDLDLDLHVDFSDNPADQTILRIAEKTIACGYEGRVSVGHLTALGAMPLADAAHVIARIREAGIHVVTLPATDLYLNGREYPVLSPRGLTPVRRLLDAGVNVCLSSNNIRNAFTPLGRADPLEIAFLLAYAGHMGSPDDCRCLLEMITIRPARALRISQEYGIGVGRKADLVILDSTRLDEVVADQPDRLFVIKNGRVIVETRRHVTFPQPPPS